MKSDIHHFWELLLAMTQKELQARYKYTIFGFFWLVANPLLQMIIIFFVFSFFVKDPIPNYQYYLFVGLLIWNFFSLSLTKGTPSIVNDRSLIKKAKFSREIIPLSIILSNFIHLILALILYVIPIYFINTLTYVGIVYIAIGLFLLIIFTSGLCFLTSALNVKYRDINFFVQALLIIWFYATPIVYSISIIPNDVLWLWNFNPMTSIVQLIQNGFIKAKPPETTILASNIIIIILTFILGIIVFKRENKNFDDWI